MATVTSVTPESIARNKAYRDTEREKVYQVTGIRIVDAPPFIICCNRLGCRFSASAMTDGGAMRALAAHLVGAHMKKEQA